MSRGWFRSRTAKRGRGQPDSGLIAETQRRASVDVAASVDFETARVLLAESNRSRRLRIQDLVRKHRSPDSGTTIYNYDEAGNVTTMKEAYGVGGSVTHTFTYDYMNRLTAANYGSITCGAQQGAEIQYIYDDYSSSCPQGVPCDNQDGRLAVVKTKMWCDTSEDDDTFDQFTYFSYDDAGRILSEYIRDDGTRSAVATYSWDKNGNNTRIQYPMGPQVDFEYGDTGNSDRDDLEEIERYTADLITEGAWLPFGPIDEYRQENTQNSNKIWARFDWDLAYRPKEVLYEENSSGTDLFEIDYTLDYAGRTTVRDFSHAHASVKDAYYTYDKLGRVTCDGAASGTCPTTSPNLKTAMTASPEYTNGGDRDTMKHAHSTYGTYTYTTNLTSGKDQISSVSGGPCSASYYWDYRGNRTKDDCTSVSHDQREYTYDGRNNVLTITGEYYYRFYPSSWHDYTISNAYDERNRRIFKSFYDEDEETEAQWFFYYDVFDRLVSVKHTPDISSPSTYTLYEFYWIDSRPVAYYQTSYPSVTTARRFTHADELNRPVDVWSWPGTGDAERVWAINPDLFGWDEIVVGNLWYAPVYQPLRFPGQYVDVETESQINGRMGPVAVRPPLHENRHRTYDPYTGTYLQVDPKVEDTWEAYNYVEQNPVMFADPWGNAPIKPGMPYGRFELTVLGGLRFEEDAKGCMADFRDNHDWGALWDCLFDSLERNSKGGPWRPPDLPPPPEPPPIWITPRGDWERWC